MKPVLSQLETQRVIALAALLWAVIFVLTLASGVSAQWLEHVHKPEDYARALLEHNSVFRWHLWLDLLFLATYMTANIALVQLLAQRQGVSWFHTLLLVFGLAAGVLDLIEDQRLLATLSAAAQGVFPTLGQLADQQQVSQLKWMLGHLALVWLGIVLPARTWADRIFKFALIVIQLIVGAAVFVVNDDAWRNELIRARALNLGVGFAYLAWYVGRLPMEKTEATSAESR